MNAPVHPTTFAAFKTRTGNPVRDYMAIYNELKREEARTGGADLPNTGGWSVR